MVPTFRKANKVSNSNLLKKWLLPGAGLAVQNIIRILPENPETSPVPNGQPPPRLDNQPGQKF
jgi:hypothetical protein